MSLDAATARSWAAIKAGMREDRAWWASYDPVAFLWLCRAERRGAIVPWSSP
jgi:hypothetical protein